MKNLIRIGTLTILVISLMGTLAFASTEEYGSTGASNDTIYTLEEMLQYALEDEYMAQYEYEAIISELGAGRPFTNILEAEKVHITEVEALYNALGIQIPTVDPSSMVVIPASIEEALAVGVQAEIANIAMYEAFLDQDLPKEVRDTFEALMRASKSHLTAFSQTGGLGRGMIGNNGQQQNGNLDMDGARTGTTNNNGKGQGGSGNGQRGQGVSNKEAGTRMNQNNDGSCILN